MTFEGENPSVSQRVCCRQGNFDRRALTQEARSLVRNRDVSGQAMQRIISRKPLPYGALFGCIVEPLDLTVLGTHHRGHPLLCSGAIRRRAAQRRRTRGSVASDGALVKLLIAIDAKGGFVDDAVLLDRLEVRPFGRADGTPRNTGRFDCWLEGHNELRATAAGTDATAKPVMRLDLVERLPASWTAAVDYWRHHREAAAAMVARACESHGRSPWTARSTRRRRTCACSRLRENAWTNRRGGAVTAHDTSLRIASR